MDEQLFLQIWSPGVCWEVAAGPHGRSSLTSVISTVAAPACTSINSAYIFPLLHVAFSWLLRMLTIFKVINQPFVFGLLRTTLLFACPMFIIGLFAFLVFLFFFEFFLCSRNQHFVRCTAVRIFFYHSVGYLLTGMCCLLLCWDLLVVWGPVFQLLLLMPGLQVSCSEVFFLCQ